MSDTEVLDKTFHLILKRMVDTGHAPHYTEIAAELGVSPEDGRKTMHTLFKSGIYGWLFPNTDYFSKMKTYIGELIGEVGSNDKIGIFLKS
jgi:hypothetical protein